MPSTEDLLLDQLDECEQARTALKTQNEKALIIAFVQGAKFWEYQKSNATMWQSDQNKAEQEAKTLLHTGKLGKGV